MKKLPAGSCLLVQVFLDLLVNAVRVEFVFFQKLKRGAGFPVGVIDSNSLHRGRKFFREKFGNRASESSDYAVLFHGYDFSGLPRGFKNDFFIERFDRVDVDHFGVHPVFLKLLRSVKRLGHFKARSKDSQVLSFLELDAFSEFEHVVFRIVDHRNGEPPEPRLSLRYHPKD